ncbi:MAG: carboxylate-amine ligase [Chloroflexota bacterium]|nr:carboxylate-amine ligase [Chloroflexota bacterium]
MPARFTLGVEEEFQLVSRQTGQLCSCADKIIEKGRKYFGEKIKPEMTQSTIEIASAICPDIAGVRKELYALRPQLVQLLAEEGLVPIRAGTHPVGRWQDQQRTDGARFIALEEEEQDVGRSLVIFGLHIHVGVENKELAVTLMNQARMWLPHLLALSSNSPFWIGRCTGVKSYRSVVWKRCHRSGLPEIFPNWEDFNRYVQTLIEMGCIDNGRRLWWDVRPHPFFNTLEFRICDMPATIEDSIALTALCQALIAKLMWLHQRGIRAHALPRSYIDENKWRAMRYGLDARVVDFVNHRMLSMRDSIHELLDFVQDTVDDLGSHKEMTYLRALLDDPRGTGADRQVAVYRQTGDVQKVIEFLMEQSLQGIVPGAA